MDSKQVKRFKWKIENFSSIKQKLYYSDDFVVGGNRWRVFIYPKGNNVEKLSIYLQFADSATLPAGLSIYAQIRFTIISQIDRKNSITRGIWHDFSTKDSSWGYPSLLPLSELHDPSKGYLVNDACVLQVDVSTDKTLNLLSYEFMDETDSAESEGMKTDDDKPATKMQKPVKGQKTVATKSETNGNFSKQVRRFTWKIDNFSSIKQKRYYSDDFFFEGSKWRVYIDPKGNNVEKLSIYLQFADSATLPQGLSKYAQVRFTIINQIDHKNSIRRGIWHDFSTKEPSWGLILLPLSELHDPSKGYLVNDACLLQVDVSTDRTLNLMSYESEGTETDYCKPAIKGQKTVVTKSEEIPVPDTRPSQSETNIEPEDPMDKEVDTFLTSLESELANHKIYSQEEAKEALAKIEEALKIAPGNFYETGKCSPLDRAFKVIFNSDCFSALTIEQKTELLAMEKSFKELNEWVVKAMQDKNLLSEKESIKLTLTRELEGSLNFLKEGKAELKQIEQKITALLEQVDEEQKKKTNFLAGWKDKYKITKDKKMELEALGKKWPEYEAKAKAAEEVEKTVAAEWKRMKDFISSVKERLVNGTNYNKCHA